MVVRWIFTDPVLATTWVVPMNPNAMTSPFKKHNTITTATSPQSGLAAGVRTNDVAVEWQFSGSLNTQDHYNQLLFWSQKANAVHITDHMGRTWNCFITQFNPESKATGAKSAWRFTYTMSALVYGRIS